MTENALALLEDKNPIQYFTPKGLDPIIEKLKEEVAKFVPDISTDEGRKEVASFAYKIAKSKTAIDNLGKQLVASEKERIKAVDAERARAWDVIESMQKEVRRPLTEWEEKNEQRIANQRYILREIEFLPICHNETSIAEIERRIGVLSEFATHDFEEFTALSKIAIDDASKALTQKLAAVKKAEADRIELERLQKAEAERLQKERDEKLQAEAAARAKAEAEAKAQAEIDGAKERERLAQEQAKRAEEQRIAAAEKSKRDAIAAEAKAKKDAEEAVRKERERAEAEKQAELQAAAKREADKAHRGKINREALEVLKTLVDEEVGKRIIEAIAKGQVPHLRISY